MKKENVKPSEVQHDPEVLERSKVLAAHLAELLYAQEETTQEKIVAAGIVFSSMAAMHGIPLPHAINLLVGCYGLADNFFETAGPMQ
jgi:hypothetical protein